MCKTALIYAPQFVLEITKKKKENPPREICGKMRNKKHKQKAETIIKQQKNTTAKSDSSKSINKIGFAINKFTQNPETRGTQANDSAKPLRAPSFVNGKRFFFF